VGDVHRGIAPSPRERRHRVASERLAAGDASIFARAAGDDVGVAAQIRLLLIEITRVDEKYIDGACVLADADGRTGGMRRVIKASRSARRDTPVLVKMWLRCVRAVAFGGLVGVQDARLAVHDDHTNIDRVLQVLLRDRILRRRRGSWRRARRRSHLRKSYP